MGVPPSKRPTVHVRYCHYAPITPRSNSGFLDRGQAHAGRRIEVSLALTNREFLFRHESQGKPLARGFLIFLAMDACSIPLCRSLCRPLLGARDVGGKGAPRSQRSDPRYVPVNPITAPNNRISRKQYPYSACLQMTVGGGRVSISEK